MTHNKYNPDTYHNDIALIKLSKPIKFSRFILPACIPEKEFAESVTQQTSSQFTNKKFILSFQTSYQSSHELHFCTGSDAATRRHGQRFRSPWWKQANIPHPAAPYYSLCGPANLHQIHFTAHLSPHVLRRLWWDSKGRLPGWQRRAARDTLQQHLLYHWHCELGWGLRTKGQIRHLHTGVQVHQLDPRWHRQTDSQRTEQ